MLFSFRPPLDYKLPNRGYLIGHATSQDLTHWTRHDETGGLCPSLTGWDSETISYANVFSADGEIYALYQGNGMGVTGFGIARLDQASLQEANNA